MDKKEWRGPAALLIFFTGIFISWPVQANDDEDLGIEIKSYTNVSPDAAVKRSRVLAKRYEDMGDRLGNAIGIPSSPVKKSEVVSAVSATPAAPSKSDPLKKSSGFEGNAVVTMKNGQVMSGARIVEKDKKGVWIELDEGTKFYLSNAEIKEIKY